MTPADLDKLDQLEQSFIQAVSPSIKVPANGGSMDIPGSYSGVINGIWEAGATGTASWHYSPLAPYRQRWASVIDKVYDIPGISKPVISSQPIYKGSNFTWGEATRDGERLPIATFFEGRWIPSQTITGNMIQLARELDKLRAEFGDRPITITSWLRPPAINKIVGGVPNSQHLLGWAADLQIQGYAPHQVAKRLDPTWQGGLGDRVSFTHLDLRHLLGKPQGRWDYGNA